MNRFWRATLVLLTVTIASAASQATGQDVEVLNQWYSRGVHAYFSGDLRTAEQMLTRAIDAGTEDPRAYYFRAMARLRQGRRAEAESDLARGADLEVQDTGGIYPVGRSLERIQGRERLIIESHRRRARTVAYRQRQQRSRQRYERLQRREEDVLRRQITVPLEQLGGSGQSPVVSAPPVTPQRPVPQAAPQGTPPERPQQPPSDTSAPSPTSEDADVVAVPAEEKLEASELGSTLMRIFSRAVSDDTPQADSPDQVPEAAPVTPMPAPGETMPADGPGEDSDPEDALEALFEDEPPAAEEPAEDPADVFSGESEDEAASEDNPFLDDPEPSEPADDVPPSEDEASDLEELFSDP